MGLLTLAVWWFAFLQLQGLEQELADEQVAVVAKVVAGRLAEVTRLHKEFIDVLANEPQLVDLFKQQDAGALQRRALQMKRRIPDALQVHLLPTGISEPRTHLTPHLSYASLEQLRQAERRSGVLPAEVHQFGTPQQHISLVTSVRQQGGGEAVGLIQVSFPVDALQQALDTVEGYSGRIELRQQVPDSANLSLAWRGPEGLAEAAPGGRLPVDGSIWQVAYWSAGNHWFTLQSSLFFIPVLVLIALNTGLLWWLMARIRKALKRDQRSVVSLVEGLVMGRPPKQYEAQLTEMQSTLDVLLHQAREHRTRVAERQKAASPLTAGVQSAGPAGVKPPGLAVPQVTAADNTQIAPVSHENIELPASIFRAYDIRGVVGETLSPQVVNLLGQGIGSEIFEQGLQSVVVARDGRESSEALHNALIAGLQATGRDVIDVGLVPTPLLYFAGHELEGDCAVMVTGSHNARDYNGLKITVQNESLSPEAIQDLRRRIDSGQLLRGAGSFDSRDIIPEYIERIVSDVRLARPMKVVVDCGNGVASVVAPELYRQMGCEVVELFCAVDGRFPNHHPDPCQPENMQALQRAVLEHQADIGFAFDGDGDRIGVVDSAGKLIWPDRLLMYLAIDTLTREPGGDIIYDVKCTRHLANVVLSNGGRPLMWKSGHSMLKAKMKETQALLAGEFSGHIIFSERWYGFDDGLYAGARLLEILGLDYRTSAEVFAELPEGVSTPEYSLPLPEGESRKIMQALDQLPDLSDARSIKIDGLRVEFEQGWGLVRASNTAPALLFRFEADSEDGLERVQGVFRELMMKVAPTLKLPF
jgi:phosphomannomutase/phosphoglucomutase